MAYQVGTRPSFNYYLQRYTGENQIAAAVTLTEKVYVRAIGAYFAGGSGATITARLCVWAVGGGVLVQSPQVSIGPGSDAYGGQTYQQMPPEATNPTLDAGTYLVGWWRTNNQWCDWSFNSGAGTQYYNTSAAPGSMAGAASRAGDIGRYLMVDTWTATPPTAKLEGYVRRSGTWSPLYDLQLYSRVRRGGAWTGSVMPRVRRSGTWPPVTP